eukprot:CAMPEP_0117455914 /NCGR_PEP_ID=MMETSP0759-20121206/11607_1 /TAXON_ID=63605 /ORGANISM="Percolomonas cosmopolitus, Strain WS" /LENGTH=287 /DNA_ID=CAMNT_0005249237 /DNA_START=462 /DNA_END=1325 /DNA_ORIENTATION=+
MEGCFSIEDSAFENLRTLEYIKISSCRQLTDKCFSSLRRVKQCIMNDVNQEAVSDKALENLRQCHSVAMMFCSQSSITNKGMHNLSRAQEVEISRCSQLTDDALKYLRCVQVLSISGCTGLTNASLVNLRGRARELHANSTPQFHNEGFKNLRGIARLFAERNDNVNGETLKQLRGIEELSLNGCKKASLSDDDFANLAGIKILALVDGPQTITKDMLRHISGVESLTLVNTESIRVDREHLDTVKHYLRNIRHLSVSTTFGDKDVRQEIRRYVETKGGLYDEYEPQ